MLKFGIKGHDAYNLLSNALASKQTNKQPKFYIDSELKQMQQNVNNC